MTGGDWGVPTNLFLYTWHWALRYWRSPASPSGGKESCTRAASVWTETRESAVRTIRKLESRTNLPFSVSLIWGLQKKSGHVPACHIQNWKSGHLPACHIQNWKHPRVPAWHIPGMGEFGRMAWVQICSHRKHKSINPVFQVFYTFLFHVQPWSRATWGRKCWEIYF